MPLAIVNCFRNSTKINTAFDELAKLYGTTIARDIFTAPFGFEVDAVIDAAANVLAVAISDYAVMVHDVEELANVLVTGAITAPKFNETITVVAVANELEGIVTNFVEGATVVEYIHPGNKLATIVAFAEAGVDHQVGRDVAMQAAAMNPVALNRDSVPADVIEREMEVYRAQVREEGKPENMVEKIAEGKLNKFFKESTLLSQEYTREAKVSVEEHLRKIDKDLTISSFQRAELGE